MTVGKNRIDHIYYDVAVTYHPTRMDKNGKDGVYIKSVTQISPANLIAVMNKKIKNDLREAAKKAPIK